MRQVVLISGHTCTGKSKLAGMLQLQLGFELLKTSSVINKRDANQTTEASRAGLKELGDNLDEQTDHKWLFDAVASLHNELTESRPIVVDSLRKAEQLEWFRKQNDFEVTHVHLYASRNALEQRFRARNLRRDNEASHSDLSLIKSEEDVLSFMKDADVRVYTERTQIEDIYTRVTAYLGMFASPDARLVDVLVGGQYGSEGKGQIAAYVAQEYDVLMRVGGPNAGHSAARESGKYVYHSLPSGCRESTADILIGAGATIHVTELIKEIVECNVAPRRVYIDPNVMVIAQADREAEMAMTKAIGSTGRGGGAAAARRIMGRLNGIDRAKLASDIKELKPYVKPVQARLQLAYLRKERVFLEGTQGSALSLIHGPYPHVTSRDTNVSGCLAEAGIPPGRVRKVLMVIRYAPIRVESPKGADSGPLKNETDFATVAESAGIQEELQPVEKTSTTGKNRRVGWFDWAAFRAACELNLPTDIVLTFADYHKVENRDARRFEQLHVDTIKFIEELQRIGQAPVSLINTRYPHDEVAPLDLRTVIDRRSWRVKVAPQ